MSGQLGQRDEARKIVQNLEEAARHSYVPGYFLAIAYLGLDEFDRALDWLEQGCTERAHPMPLMAVEPVFDPILAEPRFQALLQNLGLE